MPNATTLQNDPAQPLGMNIVGESPHVFVYRVWKKEATDPKYVVVRDGDTTDATPDHFDIGPFPDGTRVAYWIAIAGKPSSATRVSVIFAQGGRVPAGGALTHDGKTSAKGGEVVEHEVVLI